MNSRSAEGSRAMGANSACVHRHSVEEFITHEWYCTPCKVCAPLK